MLGNSAAAFAAAAFAAAFATSAKAVAKTKAAAAPAAAKAAAELPSKLFSTFQISLVPKPYGKNVVLKNLHAQPRTGTQCHARPQK